MLKLRTTAAVAILLCIWSTIASAQLELNCDHDSTGLIPLTDMGYGHYGPFRGGLYPYFMNDIPESHLNKGKALSNSMVPLDGAGNVDWETGGILVIGMGGSTASNAYNAMTDTLKTWDWPVTNPCVQMKGLFYGGKDLQDMITTANTDYWDFLQDKIDSRGDSWDNIQIVWLQTHSEMATNDSILFIKNMVAQYVTLLQRMQDSMANVKQVFLTGFHYTGYTHPSHELYEYLAEPKAYWGNIAIKMLIERQIAGDPELAFEGPNKKVPYLAWGPYWWADGNNPRAIDGLTWACEEYRDDDTGGGFHLEDPAKGKEALMFIDFLASNEVTSKWWLNGAAWADCPYNLPRESMPEPSAPASINTYPNPASEWLTLVLPSGVKGKLFATLASINGEVVMTDYISADDSRTFSMPVAQYPNGIYQLTLSNNNNVYSAKIVVQH